VPGRPIVFVTSEITGLWPRITLSQDSDDFQFPEEFNLHSSSEASLPERQLQHSQLPHSLPTHSPKIIRREDRVSVDDGGDTIQIQRPEPHCLGTIDPRVLGEVDATWRGSMIRLVGMSDIIIICRLTPIICRLASIICRLAPLICRLAVLARSEYEKHEEPDPSYHMIHCSTSTNIWNRNQR